MTISKTQLAASSGDLAALNEVVPVQPGLPALKQYLSKVQKLNPSQTINGETFDSLDGKSDWRPARRGHMPYLAIPRALAHALFDWGTVDVVDVVTPIAATELPKTWAELVRYRKANPGHAWTVGMRNILVAEEKRRNDAGQSSVRKAMVNELGEMTASALGEHIRKADAGTKSGRGRSKVA